MIKRQTEHSWSPYKDRAFKRTLYLIMFLLLLIVLSVILSLGSGYLTLTFSDIINTMMGEGTDAQRLLLYQFRLPRTILALLVGASMASAGAVFQGVTENGLADPGIIGIHSGSGFFVVLFLYLTSLNNTTVPTWADRGLTFIAFLGGLTAAALIYLLAWKKGVTPVRLVLVGIGINSGFAAALMLVQLRMSESDFNRAITWLSGSIWNASWATVLRLLPWFLIFFPLALYKARVLSIMQLGEEMAVGLGSSIQKERLILLVLGVALAASSVASAGGIAFVGLVAPHLARRLVGGKYQRLIPISACIGALLIILSDSIARSVLAPSEIPVGLIVAVIGAPYFIYLLITIKE